jgi:inhibitor of the pro-sigma K processing machinery
VDARTALSLVLATVVLYIGVRAFWGPIRWGLRLVMNAALGALAFYAWNHWSHLPHLAVGVNPVTAATVGLLGAPGFALVLAVRFLLA